MQVHQRTPKRGGGSGNFRGTSSFTVIPSYDPTKNIVAVVPQSEIRVKFLACYFKRPAKNAANFFAGFRLSISRENGHKNWKFSGLARPLTIRAHIISGMFAYASKMRVRKGGLSYRRGNHPSQDRNEPARRWKSDEGLFFDILKVYRAIFHIGAMF